MTGIEHIATYIPPTRVNNLARLTELKADHNLVSEKIGITSLSRRAPGEKVTEMCLAAYRALERQGVKLDPSEIDLVVVEGLNPDFKIPHVSAMIHGHLGLKETCASFDIAMGCTGYIYGLAAVQSFIERMGLKKALLFTADPYSVVTDQRDRNTALILGDAATVTLLGNSPALRIDAFDFGTVGRRWESLVCKDEGPLTMNGRDVFNFCATEVTRRLRQFLESRKYPLDETDLFIFHQANRYIIKEMTERLKVDPERVPFLAGDYGNTGSSSIPLVLANYLADSGKNRMVLSAFGSGLSWASATLHR